MGNSSSSTAPKGKKVVTAKLDTSTKTGILNLAGQDLKASSSTWERLSEAIFTSKLTSLDISHNTKLCTLPVVVCQLILLKHLTLSHCSISILPDLTSLINLTNLKADHNNLTFATVQGLPEGLIKLDLSCNQLIAISPPIARLRNLMVLNLCNNRIDDLSGLSEMALLVELLLDHNQLTHIPLPLSTCNKLQTLSLAHNALSWQHHGTQSIPSVLFTRTALLTLQLAGNPLTKREVQQWKGIDALLERRRNAKDKLLQGGGLADSSLFGLD